MLLTGIVVPVLMSLGLGVYAQNLGGAAVEYAVIVVYLFLCYSSCRVKLPPIFPL